MLLNAHSTDRIAGLIDTLGTEKFGPQFYALFNDVLNTKQCSVFTFSPSGGRSSLFAEGRDENDRCMARALAGEYVDWAFERDENVRSALVAINERRAQVNVFTFAANEFKDRTYRRQFYDEPQLSGKLVVLAHLDHTLYYVNFYRDARDPTFTEKDVVTARLLAQLGVRALARHREMSSWEALPGQHSVNPKQSERSATFDQMRDGLLAAHAGLTHREAEICAGIMIGYTTLGLSLLLGITTNTVATHRKRAYAKLNISSQNALFSHYLKYIRNTSPSTTTPPNGVSSPAGVSDVKVRPGARNRRFRQLTG